MKIITFLKECTNGIYTSIVSFFFGKKVKENECLQQENQKLRKQMALAVRPDESWDKLLDWLRQQ